MPAILDILRGLGLGEQAMVAAALLLVVMYLFRSKKMIGTVAGMFAQAWFAAVVIAVTIAGAILFNWVDPNPAAFVGDVLAGIRLAVEVVTGPVEQWLRGLAS